MLTFKDITSGSYAFMWSVATGGYRLLSQSDCAAKPGTIDEGPWLTPPSLAGYEIRRYAPLTKPTLHRKFASLHSEESMLRFANDYGLLGCPQTKSRTYNGANALVIGESVNQWRREAHDLGTVLAIWDLVSSRDAGKVGQLVKWRGRRIIIEFQGEYSPDRRRWRALPLLGKPRPDLGRLSKVLADARLGSGWLLDRWRMGDVIEPARCYVLGEVNNKLKGCASPQILVPADKGDPPDKIYLFPSSLLGALWVMFLMEITGRTRVAQCEVCGEWVVRGLRRERCYCSGRCRQTHFRRTQRERRREST